MIARLHHPDKFGKGGEDISIKLSKAAETIEDDEKRWAYERFVPKVDWWKKGHRRGYIITWCTSAFVFYSASGCSLALLSLFRTDERGTGFVSATLPVSKRAFDRARHRQLLLSIALESYLILQ
ncbi:hypothetical protein RQP46_011294 [Phenoliferia psychrophenolica]